MMLSNRLSPLGASSPPNGTRKVVSRWQAKLGFDLPGSPRAAQVSHAWRRPSDTSWAMRGELSDCELLGALLGNFRGVEQRDGMLPDLFCLLFLADGDVQNTPDDHD